MMKRSFLFFLLFSASLFLASFASAYPVTLSNFTGDDAEVLLEITGDGTSNITFDAQVVNPGFADLRGIFFDFLNSPLPGDLTVTGTDVTSFLFVKNGVDDLGGGANIKPEGPFDAGVEIGTQGIGNDDFYSTQFTVSSIGGNILELGTNFGARLTSVGDNREGSSKLAGIYDGPVDPPGVAPIPEPSTIFLMGLGLAGLGVTSYRKGNRK